MAYLLPPVLFVHIDYGHCYVVHRTVFIERNIDPVHRHRDVLHLPIYIGSQQHLHK